MTGLPQSHEHRAPSRPARSILLKVISAAGLSAAVLLSATVGLQAQDDRVPAGPANMFRPGAVFTYYAGTADPQKVEGLNSALNTMTAQSAETANMVSSARAGIEKGVAAGAPDALARAVLTSIEETFSIVVQAGFLRAIQQTNPSFGDLLTTSLSTVALPDGDSIEVPVLLAAAIHSLNVAAAGGKLRDGAAPYDLLGNYTLTATGTCAMESSPVAIRQTDFVFEGVVDGRLTLFGTIGNDRIYIIANEPRFARVKEADQGPPSIQVPDEPLDLFEATLPADGEPIAFRSITRGTCAFTLAEAG